MASSKASSTHTTATAGGIPAVTYAPREPRLSRPPFWMIAGFLIAVVASWLPLVLAARARVYKSVEPRIMLMQDMFQQPKLMPQSATDLFADGRAMRPAVPGTVGRGQLEEDDHYYRGYSRGADGKVTFFTDFPAQVAVTPTLVRRGQERFNIYCAVCHGQDGYGEGPVHMRANDLQVAGASGMSWTPPANLHKDTFRGRPNGHIYNTINVGIRNMPPYGGQIPPADRWAIVAYVRALQLSQDAPPSDVPPDKAVALK